jgi:ABC-type multidrug transport system fused ATPase/permease subunit
MEEAEIRRFERHARSSQEAYVRVMTLSSFGGLVTDAVAGLGVAAIVFLGARAALDGTMTVGQLLVFIAYLHALYGPVTQLAGSAMVVQRSSASIERVVHIFDQEDEHAGPGRLRLEHVSGRLAYRGVSASYEERRLVLKDIVLTIEPGERVAFVGRSGAGKTTLVSLLLRFYRPAAGQVLLDGVDIQRLELTWLRQQIALVLQEPIIFSGTLAENIAYGRPGASEADIVAASRAAGLDEFVRELPDGYDTQVGERGVRLSGGQRQRLSIARAFLKDAPILILDEPTSNLDATTEQHVFESIDRLAHGRTTLVISHRLATAQRADRIVVLADGRIVEEGTHQVLLARDGAYAALYRHQTTPGRVERLPGAARN